MPVGVIAKNRGAGLRKHLWAPRHGLQLEAHIVDRPGNRIGREVCQHERFAQRRKFSVGVLTVNGIRQQTRHRCDDGSNQDQHKAAEGEATFKKHGRTQQ